MKIVNLTQHSATPDQIQSGVMNLQGDDLSILKNLLTFVDLPDKSTIVERANQIADLAVKSGASRAMIGGAPFLMGALESALKARGVQPLYAFSKREVVETVNDDGSVSKTAVFRHLGFVAV
jgi:hypothetical protein